MGDDRYHGPGVMVLADGRVFRGQGFGARGTCVGELVFNTSLYGYQEIVSDPSYCGQIVCLTAVEIGNVGANPEDEESEQPAAVGLVVRSLSPVVSNYRAKEPLGDWLARRGVVGLAEVDTRAITRHLRDHGAQMAAISSETEDIEALRQLAVSAPSMVGRNLVDTVTADAAYEWDEPSWRAPRAAAAAGPEAVDPELRVIAYDFGIKRNILRKLRDRGVRAKVVPASTPVSEVLAEAPHGVFLSNGPGDPAAVSAVIEQLRELLGDARSSELPLFGICLGHQLLCLALGGRTYKLEFGHHGGNHPVRDEGDGSIAITAQNHGFAVDVESLGDGAELTHLNLFDRTVAGVGLRDRPIFGVQYHPEASPGPQDSDALFDRFVAMVRERAAGERTVER
ncbi:glutamine-hydrolyzing carbamoyl-phosphate synthase small subunit [Pseudenhygromyxa sp. WMMC2535]|uniref:glutamine-hydrolyzing carbamoyl-phosphate synthase small subunit n=1 Tax=Pseudenhygromyxa sp. WMMC2535 TaxID=2712867 RepID=UPI0015565DA5|nr:glutamine-hydrolyzing carbamoyl-phosphate synthase small subunit [Pseudenhygromyxa sp. WMMC2535]NVB41175.1 glutamine-hydrolyzing carbamoyl-phosphate synthase small subunit [Pseudenhygromyxa sp. WMMC2535]